MSDIFSNQQNRIHKALLTVFLVFVIIFLGYHLSTYLHKPYETETVATTTFVDEIVLDGFFVRDEQVVSDNKDGIMKCNYEDGQRVREGSDLLSIYGSQQDQINLQLVESYTREYEQLKTLSGEGAVKGSRIDIIVKQIEQLQLEYVEQLESGNFVKAIEIKESLTYQLNKLQLCKGEVSDYNDAMKQLQDKIATLSTQTSVIGNIDSPANGYFSGKTDGFETALSLKQARKLSVADAQQILASPSRTAAGIGKVVTSNDWYYCAIAETSDLTRGLHVGQKVQVKFGSLSPQTYTVTLVRTEENQNGNTLLIFKSSIMNKNFINARFEKASITINAYEGIGISKAAIRFKDKQKGVYIVRGNNLLFRKVDPIYEDEDIIISAFSTDTEYVSLYDKVVVGGELISGGS